MGLYTNFLDTTASGMALDDHAQSTAEGNRVWLYAPNGTPAQKWLLSYTE